MSIDHTKLKATPEQEDFRHKYTEGESGKIAGRLLDNYFGAVESLVDTSKIVKRKKARAIEIGCGEGFSTQRIAKFLPSNTAFDASEYVAAQLPYAKKLNPDIKITEESVYDLKHKDSQYDMVFLLEVMEHLDFPEKALKEVSRVLRKDGFLIVGVPREPLWRALNMGRGKYIKAFGNTPGHLNHWSTNAKKRFIGQNFGPVIAVRKPLPWTILLAANNK